MTRSLRAALVALLVGAALTACTAQPVTTSPTGATAAPAAAGPTFRCPEASEVAALTAVPFTGGTVGARTCTYAAEAEPGTALTVRRPASASHTTLAAIRAAAIERGTRSTDAHQLGFDGFTVTTDQDCTAWFFAPDGVATSVVARRPGTTGANVCATATATATLVGIGAASAPTVAVIAPAGLIGTTSRAEAWPYRLAEGTDARIDRLAGSGYLASTGTDSFAQTADDIPVDSAAVVFMSGTAEVGTPPLTVLRAATLALSAAASRAPKAALIVVGPVSDGTTSLSDLLTLRGTLRTASTIAGARFVDPTGGPTTPRTVALDALAVRISAELGPEIDGR